MAGTRKTATGRSASTAASQRSGVELRLVDPAQPELHRGVDESDAGEGEHGAGVEPPAPTPRRRHVADHGRIGVPDRHPFGATGRPRRVEDVGQVVLGPGDLHGAGVVAGDLGPAQLPASFLSRVAGPERRRRRRSPGTGRRRLPRGRERRARRRPLRPPPRSAPGPGPPRRGPAGGSWARPLPRPGAPPCRTPASAGPRRGRDGCPPGRPDAGPHRPTPGPGHRPLCPTPRRSAPRRRRRCRPSRSGNSSAMRRKCSSINTRSGAPRIRSAELGR